MTTTPRLMVYSEKATRFFKISNLLSSTVHTNKSRVEISQNFVAFSEYMNFKNEKKWWNGVISVYWNYTIENLEVVLRKSNLVEIQFKKDIDPIVILFSRKSFILCDLQLSRSKVPSMSFYSGFILILFRFSPNVIQI